VDARAAAAHEPGHESGDLRMTLNLEKIVPSPYFRSYWVQGNITEMKRYRSAVSDLYTESGDFREERVLLAKSSPEGDTASAPGGDLIDLADLTALLPAHAGVYRAVAGPGMEAALAGLDEKLLARRTGVYHETRMAPEGDVAVSAVGREGDFETRIDSANAANSAPVADALGPLRQVLTDAGLEAMMTVSRTGEAADGVWIPFQSAVVLSSAKDWSAEAVEDAVRAGMQAHLTAGGLGLSWKTVQAGQGSYQEISAVRPLELAVHGKLCILADDPGLLLEMLGHASHSDAHTGVHGDSRATIVAGFDLPQEREAFARWAALVDRGAGGAPAGAPESNGGGGEPAFFSRNMRGLSDVFAALESERFAERREGPLIRQTVTYAWRR
jgi:hypothetical protein